MAADIRSGAIVTITDTGSGISEDHQAKLFKPFFTTKGELGIGLDLWISRGIVEKHGGKIELTNSSDPMFRGAMVRVYLPSLGPATTTIPAAGHESEVVRSQLSSFPLDRIEQA